jgi:hypothetical protein
LLNLYIPDAVLPQDINLRVYDERSHFNKVENHQRFIKCAKEKGCPLPCVGLGDLIDPKVWRTNTLALIRQQVVVLMASAVVQQTHIVLAVVDQIVTVCIVRELLLLWRQDLIAHALHTHHVCVGLVGVLIGFDQTRQGFSSDVTIGKRTCHSMKPWPNRQAKN